MGPISTNREAIVKQVVEVRIRPTLTEARLATLTGWQVVNEGINGDTSAGALKPSAGAPAC